MESEGMESEGMENERTEYKFAELYDNNKAKGLTFMIYGDKFIGKYRVGDPQIRNDEGFVCELWGFHEASGLRYKGHVIRDLIFINRESEQLLRISNIDGKLYTSNCVNYSNIYIELPDQFTIFSIKT